MVDRPARATPLRVTTGFVLLFVVYQAAEGIQTVFAPTSPAGPALMLLALALAWPVGRWLGWRGYDAYALDLRRRSPALIVAGMAVALLAKLAMVGVGLRFGVYVADPATPGAGIAGPLLAGLLITFVPSVAEDIITRGFPLRAAGLRWTAAGYVAASAILYTLNHVWRFDWGWTEQARLVCMGLAYAAAAWRWRTLWAAVALHWGWNYAGIVTGQFVPVTPVDADLARLMGAGVHLLLLILICLPTGSRRLTAD